MSEESYRKTFLNGADALYFSQSRDENETWLPLLEKAYAKAHGDYQSIEGGFTGEAIEDLTGGITTEVCDSPPSPRLGSTIGGHCPDSF